MGLEIWSIGTPYAWVVVSDWLARTEGALQGLFGQNLNCGHTTVTEILGATPYPQGKRATFPR